MPARLTVEEQRSEALRGSGRHGVGPLGEGGVIVGVGLLLVAALAAVCHVHLDQGAHDDRVGRGVALLKGIATELRWRQTRRRGQSMGARASEGSQRDAEGIAAPPELDRPRSYLLVSHLPPRRSLRSGNPKDA